MKYTNAIAQCAKNGDLEAATVDRKAIQSYIKLYISTSIKNTHFR
jgi:hypothetical protein